MHICKFVYDVSLKVTLKVYVLSNLKAQKSLVLLYLDKFKMKTTFTENNSMIFLGKMLKCTDETLLTSRVCKRGNKKIEVPLSEDKSEREKLVLKFTRCLILDCAKEEDLMKRR